MDRAAESQRPFAILVCFDDTEASGYAFEEAMHVARRIPSSEIHLVDVRPKEMPDSETLQLAGRLRTYVNEKAASLGDTTGQSVAVHVRYGDAMRAIVELAADIGIDLIVLGNAKHPHWQNLVAGSLADKLLRHAPCPDLVAGPKPAESRAQPPRVEPPCPDCLKVRASTHGSQWWCSRHATGGALGLHAHGYSYQGEIPFAVHDSEVIPTGVDM